MSETGIPEMGVEDMDIKNVGNKISEPPEMACII